MCKNLFVEGLVAASHESTDEGGNVRMKSDSTRNVRRTLSVEPGQVVLKDHVETFPGKENSFIREWLSAAETVRRRNGFISMALYQDKKEDEEELPGFTSVVVWKTLVELDAALNIEDFFRGEETSYPPVPRTEQDSAPM